VYDPIADALKDLRTMNLGKDVCEIVRTWDMAGLKNRLVPKDTDPFLAIDML